MTQRANDHDKDLDGLIRIGQVVAENVEAFHGRTNWR